MDFWRNRIAIAVAGLIIFGAFGIFLSLPRPSHATLVANDTSTQSSSTQNSMSATETPTDLPTSPTATVVMHVQSTATSTPTPRPTATSVFAQTATPTPQSVTLHGTVQTVSTANGGSFTMSTNGNGTFTVVVNTYTHYQGLSSISDLHKGTAVDVTGTTSGNGIVLAMSIQVNNDN